MPNFNVRSAAMRPKSRAHAFTIFEGRYRGGIYQLIKLDSKNLRADIKTPAVLKNPSFLDGYSQTLPQGRISDVPPSPIKTVLGKGAEFKGAGKALMEDFARETPQAVLISDGSNYPFNEGHFVIREGELLPLPPGSHPITGKHYLLSTSNGLLTFKLVNTDDAAEVKKAEEGFFVPKIIHAGRGIGLLDKVPGTGSISIADFRGHIGQIIKEEGAKPGTPERVAINTQLLEYLRDPKIYMNILSDIIQGRSVDFGTLGQITFSLNPYNHTYWVEADSGEIYCLKTYPTPIQDHPVGVTFMDGPDFLFEVARVHNFEIENAYIGTNGKDVRTIIPQNGVPETLMTTLDGTPFGFGTYLLKNPLSLANFIAFSNI